MTLNLPHPDPFDMGPFCRLRVNTAAPQEPGVYAWVADGQVCYVGKAVEGFGLVQKVKGQSLGMAYDDLHLLSSVQRRSSSRRPVAESMGYSKHRSLQVIVEWWWLVAARPREVEELLIQRWNLSWNIALRRQE